MALEYDIQGEDLNTRDFSGILPENFSQLSTPTEPDDRYPGSFFRIPGVPSLGTTTWRLSD